MTMKNKSDNILHFLPFSSHLRKSICVIKHPFLEDTIRIYKKGAPEEIINSSENQYNEECSLVQFSQEQKEYNERIVLNE